MSSTASVNETSAAATDSSPITATFKSLPLDTRCFICQELLYYVPSDSEARFLQKFWHARASGELQKFVTDSACAEREEASKTKISQFAVSACHTRTHVLCAEPCALLFCALNRQNHCPLCRGQLAAPLAICLQLCRSEDETQVVQQRLRSVNNRASAAIRRTFAQLEGCVREHLAREPMWRVRPTIGAASGSAVHVGAHRQSHDVNVTLDRFSESRTNADEAANMSELLTWTRQAPNSSMSASQTLRGPWPAVIGEGEVLALCEHVLGVQLQTLERTGSVPRGLALADLKRLRKDLLSELQFFTRQRASTEHYFDIGQIFDERGTAEPRAANGEQDASLHDNGNHDYGDGDTNEPQTGE